MSLATVTTSLAEWYFIHYVTMLPSMRTRTSEIKIRKEETAETAEQEKLKSKKWKKSKYDQCKVTLEISGRTLSRMNVDQKNNIP